MGEGDDMAKTTAAAVADYILSYAQQRGIPVTNLKLQKLLYFCFGCYLARTGEVLFDDPLEAWPKGPVQPDQWRRFNDFGKLPITVIEGAAAMATGVRSDVINETLDSYLPLDQWVLVQLSHGTAWAAARGGLEAQERCNARLDRVLTAAEFEDMLKERDAVLDDPEDWPLEDAAAKMSLPMPINGETVTFTLSSKDLKGLADAMARSDSSRARRFNPKNAA